jgi:hypothetical protein
VMSGVAVVVRRSSKSLTLNLGSRLGKNGDIAVAVVVVEVNGRVGESKTRVAVGRRDIGRGQGGSRRRADALGSGRRRHHRLRVHMRRKALVLLVLLLMLLALVAPSRIGVVMNPRVSSQLVRARELLAASRELASVGLLSGVSADVSSLVLQAVECLLAERALVRSRELIGVIRRLGARERPVGLDDSNCGGSHLNVGFVQILGRWGCGIQEVGKIHGRLCSLHVIHLLFPKTTHKEILAVAEPEDLTDKSPVSVSVRSRVG